MSLRRLVTRAAVVAATASAAFVAVPSSAYASAYGCAGMDCISVNGSGLHVNWIEAKVWEGPRRTDDGQFHIKGPGFSYYTGWVHVHNESWFHSQSYSHTWYLNRYLPNGSQVCAQFAGRSYACETIHS